MTIKEELTARRVGNGERRLAKLIEVQAPEVILEGERNIIEDWKTGRVKVKGIKEYGDLEFTKHEVRTGGGGKQFIVYTTAQGELMAYQGNWGWFIKPFVPYTKSAAA